MSVSTGCAPDDQYVLGRAESDWHWDKQSMECAWEKIDSVSSNATPIGQCKMQTAECRLGTKCRLRIKTVSRLIRDMSSSNIHALSVTQSLFRGHPSFNPAMAKVFHLSSMPYCLLPFLTNNMTAFAQRGKI